MLSTQKVNMNSIEILPIEILVSIHKYIDPNIKKIFSAASKTLQQIGIEFTQCLRIYPPYCINNKHSPDIPDYILVKIIDKYPKAKKLIFGPMPNYSGMNEFRTKEGKYLRVLINYLTVNYQQHPLYHIKKMEIREIERDIFSDVSTESVRELNRLFMKALSHSNLESVSVTANTNGSIITGEEVKEILVESTKLKKFKLDCFQADRPIEISFTNQKHLISAKFHHFNGPTSVITSLKTCIKLQTLVLDHIKFIDANEVKHVLMNEHPRNLKRLEIREIKINSDHELNSITSKLQNLEYFDTSLCEVTEDGFEKLGKNCKNLRILKFDYPTITNNGIAKLTSHLPHLKILNFQRGYNITDDGVKAIAVNCPDLRILKMSHLKGIERPGIEALVENCIELRVLEIFGGKVVFKDLLYLAQKMTKLVYFKFSYIQGISDENVNLFKKTFSHLSKLPYSLKLKDLS